MDMGGLRIATIRGIPIRVHWTFLLVLPFLAFAFSRAFVSAADLAGVPPAQISGSPLLWGLGVALALFASVLVHELAHSLYALKKGGRVRDITLLMIGGVSQMSEAPKHPRHEAVMALMGPLTSLGLGGLFYLLFRAASAASFNARFALFYLGSLNLVLGLFNLLPAFPMDGGRVLRAALVPRLGAVGATSLAARIGKIFAVLFAVWGFFTFNMVLLLIAFFVYLGAESETRAVVVNALLGRLRVRDLMSRRVFSVPAESSVDDTAERMLRTRRLAFEATTDGRPVGLVTLEAVQAVPIDQRPVTMVGSIAVATPSLSPEEAVARALQIMSETALPQLPISEDGHLVGTLTRDAIVRGLKLSELEATQRRRIRWPRRPRSAAAPHG